MKNIIKYQLLIEGRVDDIKKQYPNLPADYIDFLSRNDPSGNNKYLGWMVNWIYRTITKNGRYDTKGEIDMYFQPTHDGGPSDMLHNRLEEYAHDLITIVHLFHKNSDRLTSERVYEAIVYVLGYIPNEMGVVRLGDGRNGIHASTHINIYSPVVLGKILKYIIEHYPSKSETDRITKSETVTIYDDDVIKIVAPQSFKSSCMYGASTQWCTTSKTRGQEYFNNYTSKNNTLIYFIFKHPTSYHKLHFGDTYRPYSDDYKMNKIALHANLSRRDYSWFDERDSQINGYEVLKNYILFSSKLKGKDSDEEFKKVSKSINQYLKSKDERTILSKILRSNKVK